MNDDTHVVYSQEETSAPKNVTFGFQQRMESHQDNDVHSDQIDNGLEFESPRAPKSPSLHDSVKAFELLSAASLQKVPTTNLTRQQKQFILKLNSNDDVWHKWIFPCNNPNTDIDSMQKNQRNKRRVKL